MDMKVEMYTLSPQSGCLNTGTLIEDNALAHID